MDQEMWSYEEIPFTPSDQDEPVILLEEEPEEWEIDEIDRSFQRALTQPFPKSITKVEKYFVRGFGYFNIPVELNEYVDYYIYLFTETKFRQHLEKWLRRYFKYEKVIRDIIKSYGLPDDLIFVAMAESGFSTRAVSPMSAVGPWQFIEETARRYKLKIDLWVDERKDLIKSTHSALNYLKDLYDMFGDWYLAWAGYNAGEKRIEKAIERAGGKKDYWYFVKRGLIPRETQGYVPKIIALALITKNLEKFGFSKDDFKDENKFEFDTVKISKQIDIFSLSKICECDVIDLWELNPSLRLPVTPPYEFELKVPKGKGKLVEERLKFFEAFATRFYPAVRHSFSPVPKDDYQKKVLGGWLYITPIKDISGKEQIISYVSLQQNLSSEDPFLDDLKESMEKGETFILPVYVYIKPFILYKVRKKVESLSSIALRFQVPVQEIKRLNGIRGNKVYKGKVLKIPTHNFSYASQPAKNSKYYSSRNSGWSNTVIVSQGKQKQVNISKFYQPTKNTIIRHRVKKGESLFLISKMYGVEIQKIRELNRLSGNRIYPGQVLLIPVN
ncbi:MAG: LysM peptidoglycan-binding domain-containing protein [Candidatus Calescibacterium sp.]|nr:LysM peptidoglycan-binding domain-containing protein [Candidatus Calescibacterium sp.]